MRVILQGGSPAWAEALVTSLNLILQNYETRIAALEKRVRELENA